MPEAGRSENKNAKRYFRGPITNKDTGIEKNTIWRCMAYSAAVVTFFLADFGAMIMSILLPSSFGSPST